MSPLERELAAALARGGITPSDVEARAIADAARGDRGAAMHMVERRARGAPLALVLGRVEFLGLPLAVAPGVLAPRAETEIVAQRAIAWVRTLSSAPIVIDVCCGAGNLACAIAHHVPSARVWASDCSEDAVALARENVSALGLSERVHVSRGDLFEPLGGLRADGEPLEGRADALVCNPPYISTGRLDGPSRALLAHEPREAFDGGPYGLTLHQRVAREGAAFVREGGLLVMEFGLDQQRQIEALLGRSRAWDAPEMIAGADGEPRAVAAYRRDR